MFRLALATLLLWLLFLGVEVTARLEELYRTHPPVDLLIHFLSGWALAGTWILFVRWRKGPVSRSRLRVIGVLGTLAVSVLWEIGEMVEERIRVNPPHLLDPFFWDGVTDLLVALVGAGMAVSVLTMGERFSGPAPRR